MSKEAMKLALEALSPWAGEDANHTEQYAAYQALREALAEQPAQHKPFTHYRHCDNGLQDWADEKTIPLYTFPPAQRKPLTDEQLSAIGSKIFPSTWNIRHVELVRAIEAAHNIKEKS